MFEGAIMQNAILYREMLDSEKDKVFDLVMAGFEEFVLSDVTREGAQEFLRATREMIFEQPAGHVILIAEYSGAIIGMIDMNINGHICLFFIAKKFQHQGLGRQLLEQAATQCRAANPAATEIDVHASLFAVPIYRKLGFREVEPAQTVNGIKFVPMTRPLRG